MSMTRAELIAGRKTWAEMTSATVIDLENKLTYAELDKLADEGSIRDADNPIFIFSMVTTKLLRRIAAGEIDLQALAKLALAGRS